MRNHTPVCVCVCLCVVWGVGCGDGGGGGGGVGWCGWWWFMVSRWNCSQRGLNWFHGTCILCVTDLTPCGLMMNGNIHLSSQTHLGELLCNGMLSGGTKPLPEPTLMNYHQYSPVTFQWGQFHSRHLSHQSLKLSWKSLTCFFFQISQGPMSSS